MEEIWKDIKGWGGYYQVSNIGRVRSLDRIVKSARLKKHCKGQILKLRYDKDGYLTVHLRNAEKGENRLVKVHRLVANAFIFNSDIFRDSIDHINGKRDDNRVENLRWCTVKENANFPLAQKNRSESIKESYKKFPELRKIRAMTFGKTRCVPITVRKNGQLIGRFDSQTEAAKHLGVSRSTISAIMLGRLQSKDYDLTKTEITE